MDSVLENSRKIKENKYKILRMSLILGNSSDDKESLDNFESSAREIDAMNQEEYLDGLSSKYYPAKTLEKERDRLDDLIAFIEGRVIQREALEEDFYNVSGYSLSDLDDIKDKDKLDEYKERLKYINLYLDNIEVIKTAKEDKDKYQSELNKARAEKDENEENNIKLEKDLSDLFKKVIDDSSILKRNALEIDKEINDINPQVLESKKTLEIFDKSFNSLKKAGISGREEKEYYSYVSNVRDDYYNKMERYYLLSLYRLIFVICSEFKDIYNKRNKIKEILDDRISLRENLDISTEDKLSKLYSLLDSQYEIILKQEEVINNIDDLTNKINECDDKLSKYEEDNNRTEILDLLREFGIIEDDTIKEDIYDTSNYNIDFSDYKNTFKYDDLDINNDIYNEVLNEDIKEKADANKVDNVSDIYKPKGEIFNTKIKNIEDIDNADVISPASIDVPEVEEETYEEPVLDNQVIEVNEPVGIDLEKITEKTRNVMIKVGQMLNPVKKEQETEKKKEPIINVAPIQDTVPRVEENKESVEEFVPVLDASVKQSTPDVLPVSNSEDELVLPSFDDLPTVSSLTNQGSISTNNNSNVDSFWENGNSEFEFPDINTWEEQ